MIETDQNFNDEILASAVTFLIEGQEDEAANLLLFCTLSINHSKWYKSSGYMGGDHYDITIEAPRVAYDVLSSESYNDTGASILKAIQAVLPTEENSAPETNFIIRATRVKISPDWKRELAESIENKATSNQGLPIQNTPLTTWAYLRFRSFSEVAIAKAFDRSKVLFFPNCMARMNDGQQRINREADFLVFDQGRWGILEVDGESYHPIAAKDHNRDRLFRKHGRILIERYTAERCRQDPDSVVKEFLELLRQPN